ncbi:MAG: ABC transporter substrate-binding protein, partial [Bradymonadaceae bacterium]
QLEHDTTDVFAYFYVGWNMDKPMFADQRVRLAMTHALNRQGIIDNVFNGLGAIQTGPFYYKHPAMDPSVEPYPFDLDKAKKLLEEAGWVDTNGDGVRDKVIDGKKVDFQFTLVAYNQPDVRSYAAVFREDLRKIGVVMNPEFVEWPMMQRRMDEKNFDAFTGGWGLSWFNDPYQIWHSSQADIPKGSNRVGFRNDEADKIIETLRETFDADERQELLRQFHRIVHDVQPYTFFYARQSVAAWNPRLKNVVFQQIRPQAYSLPWYIDEGK